MLQETIFPNFYYQLSEKEEIKVNVSEADTCMIEESL